MSSSVDREPRAPAFGPAHAALAYATGIGLAQLGRQLPARSAWSMFGPLAALLQLALLAYTPAVFVPSARDRAEGDALLAWLKTISGRVLVPYHGHLPRAGGQPTSAHQMAMLDLFKLPGDPRHVKEILRTAYADAFARHDYAAVVLDEKDFVFLPELERHYHEVPADFVRDAAALHARTGSPLRPRYLYVPR